VFCLARRSLVHEPVQNGGFSYEPEIVGLVALYLIRLQREKARATENIQVPVPLFDKQVWFDALVTKLSAIRAEQLATQRELDALMPAVLDRAFRGEL
jgi:hypothetical protein